MGAQKKRYNISPQNLENISKTASAFDFLKAETVRTLGDDTHIRQQSDILLEICCDLHWIFYPDKMLTIFSTGYCEISGWEKIVYEDFSEVNSLVHPDDAGNFLQNITEVIENKKDGFNYEFRWHCKNGEYVWLNNRCRSFKSNDGKVVFIMGLTNDISEMRYREEKLQEEELKNHLLVKTATDYIWEYDIVKQSFHFDFKIEEQIQETLLDSFSLSMLDWLKTVDTGIQDEDKLVQDIQIYDKASDASSWYEVTCFCLLNSKNEKYKVIGSMRNINYKIALEQAVFIDKLTEIYNRRAAEKDCEEAFEEFQKSGNNFAIMFMDIDDFKVVNDTYGHAAGDYVLKTISSLFKKQLELVGGEIYRWGGEEFVVILPIADNSAYIHHAELLRQGVKDTRFEWGKKKILLTVSVGISVFAHEDSCSNDAVQRADQGLYNAKSLGKNKVYFVSRQG